MAQAFPSTVVLSAVLLLAAGCGARHEYRADQLNFDRLGWDSVHVAVSFARSSVIGGVAPVRPDTVIVSVFDESYGMVYAGPPGLIPLPDVQLGDRERLIVEACGTVKSRQICLQEVLLASPKRLTVEDEIHYPSGSNLDEGSFEFSFHVERRAFAGEDWETIEGDGIQGYMLASVDYAPARERGIVRLPFTGRQGRFNLSLHENYRDFRYYLDSELLDDERAAVTFEVYAGMTSRPPLVTTVSKEVVRRTESERADDVQFFVEQATGRLIDELDSFLGGRRAVAFVDEWDYDSASRTYRVDIEAEWEGSFFNRRDFEIEGELEVRDDGSEATFRLRSGNRRAVRRWRDRIDGDVMHLGTLDVRIADRPDV